MKIIITKEGQELEFDCPVRPTQPILPLVKDREWTRISVIGEASAVKAAFVNDIIYRQEWSSVILQEDGTEATEIQTRDLSDYCVAGDIIDHRDGVITVCMGKKTELELLQNQVDILDILLGKEE